VRYALVAGDLTELRRWIAEPAPRERTSVELHWLGSLLRIRVYLALGEPVRAQRELDRSQAEREPGFAGLDRIPALVLQALADRARGEPACALASLRAAVLLVELSVSAAGSASERKVYRLRVTDQTEPLLLFDEIGWNDRLGAFAPWVGKKVRVVGYYGVGFYGWDARQSEGVHVEAISAE